MSCRGKYAGVIVGLLLLTCAGPATAAEVMAASSKTDTRCGQVDRHAPKVKGGCSLQFRSTVNLDFTVLTMFGAFQLQFDKCRVDYTLHIGPAGRAWTGPPVIRTETGPGACGDIVPCRKDVEQSGPFTPVSWPARIKASGDGHLVQQLRMCFDTCMGRFEGRASLPMRRVGDHWRMRVANTQVGRSGLELSGTWRAPADSVTLRSKR